MGFLSKGLLILLGILVFVCLLIGSLFLTITLSLDYEIVKPGIITLSNEFLGGQIKEEILFMQKQCENNTDFVINIEEISKVFIIPCEIVSQGENETLDYALSLFIEEIYYKQYDCSFTDCLKEMDYPFIMISKTAQDYCKSKTYLFLVVALVFSVLMFFLIENKVNFPLVLGGILVVTSLLLKQLKKLILIVLPVEVEDFFSILITKIGSVFSIFFIIGIGLVVVGIILRFISLDTIKKKFSKEEVKEIVKEEISKIKSVQEKPKKDKIKKD